MATELLLLLLGEQVEDLLKLLSHLLFDLLGKFSGDLKLFLEMTLLFLKVEALLDISALMASGDALPLGLNWGTTDLLGPRWWTFARSLPPLTR